MLVAAALLAIGVGMALVLASPRLQSGASGTQPARAPQRIISMSPNVTECIFAMGLGDRVVGVSDWTMYPPEARDKEVVGSASAPSVERIIALRPDLIIVLGQQEKVAELCEQKGYPLLRMRMDRLETIYSGLQVLGERLGAEEEASGLIDTVRWGLEGIERQVGARPKPRVFLSLSRQPGTLAGVQTVSGETLLSELVEVAGGRNIFDDLAIPYPEVSKEALLERAPEVILEIRPGEELTEARRRQLLADWQAMPGLPAVRSGRVEFLTESHLLVPGPRVVLAARRLALALHPEALK